MARRHHAVASASAATRLEVGSVVDRRYRLRREIARGGAGAVFEAEHLFTTRSVAIKVLIEEHPSQETRARLLLEAKALTIARHPGIVLGLDAGETERGTPYLVMELLEGRTLEGILAVRRTIGVGDVVYIGLQLCDALAAAHEHGIFHRDMKPSNVFISRTESGREVAKIFDFGIARMEGGKKLTQHGALLGTPEYMAPEQLLAKDEIDARTDIYALGVTLYEALAGAVPFEGGFGEVLLKVSTQPVPPLDARCKDVSSELARAIERALSPDPDNRYASTREFAEALIQANSSDAQPTSLLGLRPKQLPPGAVALSKADGPARVPRPEVSMAPRLRAPLSAGAVPPPLPSEPQITGVVPPPLPVEPSQRRRFARAPYVTPVRILRADGSTLEGRSEDLSVGGLLVLAGRGFENEEPVRVHFALPITGKLIDIPSTAKWVKMARGGAGAVGLQFASLPPDAHAVIENYVTAMGGE